MVVEIGMITPPVGMNVYVISSMAGPMSPTRRLPRRGALLISDILRVVVLVLFPRSRCAWCGG